MSLLEDDEEWEFSQFPVVGRTTDDPDQLADLIREALGITPREQLDWSDEFIPLRKWRSATERLGVLVTQTSGVELYEMRGFSVTDSQLPLICLNATDTSNGRVFTLMHELTHIALREGGLCEWEHPQRQSPENSEVESFCPP